MLDRTISTSVSLPLRVYALLHERAEREQRSLASVVREVIQRGLDREQSSDAQRREESEG